MAWGPLLKLNDMRSALLSAEERIHHDAVALYIFQQPLKRSRDVSLWPPLPPLPQALSAFGPLTLHDAKQQTDFNPGICLIRLAKLS